MNDIAYVTEYEYASFALLLVLLGLYAARRKFPTVTNRLFVAMMTFTFLSVVFHILTTKTLSSARYLPLWFNYLIHVGYLLVYDLIGVVYMVYVTALTKKNSVTALHRFFLCFVTGAYFVLLLPTPWTKWIIYFDDEMNYCHGPLFNVLPGIFAVVYIYTMVLFIKYRKNLKSFQTVSIMIFTVISVAATIVQLIMPEQIIANFGITLTLIMFFVSLENPADYMDKINGCLNAEAFYLTVGACIERKKPFCTAAFRPEGLNYYTELLGIEERHRAYAETADKMKQHLKPRELYFLGGWRFAVLSYDRNDTPEKLAELIADFFSVPLRVRGGDAAVTPYICTLHYPDFVNSAEDVRDSIDYTLKYMKSRNITVAEASPDAIEAKKRELQILASIKQCILNDGFEMYYQPLYDVKRGGFPSAEALIRMKDSELGFISPEEFIPLAEANGLIGQIGELAFRSVCRLLKSGKPQALGVEYIEVNLSVLQCVQDRLAAQLTEIMDEYGTEPGQINFEITETAGIANNDMLLKNMDRLIKKGVTFSMDDYGTGFSTANYLITLPADIVKIDKSILWPAMKNEKAFVILKHTVEMLKSLDKEIVVEGVETEEMVRVLSDIGVDHLQGYYYSKPVPADEYISFLEKNAGVAAGK